MSKQNINILIITGAIVIVGLVVYIAVSSSRAKSIQQVGTAPVNTNTPIIDLHI